MCDVRVYFLRLHIYRSMDQIESEEKTQYNKKEDNEDNKANLPKTNDSSLPKNANKRKLDRYGKSYGKRRKNWAKERKKHKSA